MADRRTGGSPYGRSPSVHMNMSPVILSLHMISGASLPHPRTSNPTFRPDRTLARRNLILARYRGVDVYIPPEEETDTVPMPLPAPVLPPELDSLKIDVPVDSLEDSLTDRRTDAI